MMKRLSALLFCLLALLTVLPAVAQETAQWYEVEVIVFRQWEAGGADAELRRADVPPPSANNVVSLRQAEPGQPLTAFARLSPSEYRMDGIWQVLKKKNAYEPLLHVAWRQPGMDQASAPSVALPVGWQPGTEAASPLYGLIKVYRERFLHAVVDLRYGRSSGGTAEIQSEDGRVASTGDAEPAVVHKQSRRMRSGELHYLDHPTLGVLIQVTPVATAGGSR